MNSTCHKGFPDATNILNAAYSSVKNRAFSRKQTLKQKWISLLGGIICFSAFFNVIGFPALIPGTITVLLIRWRNLRVLHLKENVIFLVAWLYATFLTALSTAYSILYEKIFRHIRVVQFFPKFPYNQQLLTESTTQREIVRRDRLWKNKLPTKVPSPNFLTLVRIVGAILLAFLGDIIPGYFLALAGLLFLTDYFDGIIARTRNQETIFGKWADPIGDWLLLLSVYLFLYRLYPDFSGTFLVMLIPQVCIIIFFGIIFLVTRIMDVPRPVVWGRLRFTLYTIGVLNLLLGNKLIAQLCFYSGIIFAFVALISYATRKYQEVRKESIFNGLLRWCLHSRRIREEFCQMVRVKSCQN